MEEKMEFRAKPITIRAWHHTGGIYGAVDVARAAELEERMISISSMGVLTIYTTPDKEDSISIRPGEWLVRHANGLWAAYDNGEFEEAFEPIRQLSISA
jgi:hypothetical protein